jgi:DNA-3-methyladenine glycosylase II
MINRHTVDVEVRGPWSLATSKVFWEGFTPSALGGQEEADQLRSVFCTEATGVGPKWR